MQSKHMRLPVLETEVRPNCWLSFCKAFPQIRDASAQPAPGAEALAQSGSTLRVRREKPRKCAGLSLRTPVAARCKPAHTNGTGDD
jgi:hypothetical protein